MLSRDNKKARVIFSVYYMVRLNNSYIIMATLKLSIVNNGGRGEGRVICTESRVSKTTSGLGKL